jgi:hypothetical protein
MALQPRIRTLHDHLFSAYFPYFEKMKVGLLDHHAVCVCACACVRAPPDELLNA